MVGVRKNHSFCVRGGVRKYHIMLPTRGTVVPCVSCLWAAPGDRISSQTFLANLAPVSQGQTLPTPAWWRQCRKDTAAWITGSIQRRTGKCWGEFQWDMT